MIDSVARKEEGVKTREEREVPERREVVVREVNCILVLREVSKPPTLTDSQILRSGTREAAASPELYSTHLGNTQVLNCGDLVPYTRRAKLISIQLL